MKWLLYFTILYLSWPTNGLRQFFRGKHVGGNVLPPPVSVTSRSVSQNYFDQFLDHSDPTNEKTWKQRYFVNDEFFDKEKRNVAFLFIGGEGPANVKWMTSGAWIKSAKEYKALCFQVEHRFYGDSQPFEELSIENLRYLTSQQALDDLANFIVAMNEKHQLAPDVKWIAFGGSYSGSLAAWLRQKYPHLVYGASSASGPLLAIVDFQQYLQVVADDLRDLHSQKCVDVVQEGIKQLSDNLNNTDANIDKLFNLCTPIKNSLNNEKDIAYFFELIADNFAYIAQYNSDSKELNVTSVCDILTAESGKSSLEKLADVNNLVQEGACLDYKYDGMVKEMQNGNRSSSAVTGGMRQWFYQTCTEFAFYQTSTQTPPVFGDQFPIKFFVDYCADIYSPEIDREYLDRIVNRTNTIYGAQNIDVSNVIFVHGTVDPWYPLGIYETRDQAAPAILINGTSHCANMYEDTVLDSSELVAAKAKVHEQIGEWLKN